MKRKVIITGTVISLLCTSTVFAQNKAFEKKRNVVDYKNYSISTLLLEDFHKGTIKKEKIREKKIALTTIPTIKKKEIAINNIDLRTVSQNRGISYDKGFESLYISGIKMPKEHQKYLYDLCIEKNLDYAKTLALIKHESGFNANSISSTNDYGYMQINKGNHNNLSRTLGTANNGLDPYINMEWGTYMLSNLYSSYINQGLSGDKLDRSVWSAYNKGVAGFNKHGEATGYINRLRRDIDWVNRQLK